MKMIKFKEIENEYRTRVKAFLEQEKTLDAEKLIDLSLSLFQEIKVEGVDCEEDKEYDMLLFQYGVYNWGGSLGEHFNYDITRQFITPKNDEPYQLSLRLIFKPEGFRSCERYNCWSCDFEGLEKWAEHIKTTEGFELAQKRIPELYQINFEEI